MTMPASATAQAQPAAPVARAASRVLPETEDLDTGGFWAAARSGRLALLRCRACHRVLHLPQPLCDACRSFDVEWFDVEDTASELYSWTVVRQQVNPACSVPYTILLVALRAFPEVRLLGHLHGAPDLVAGMPMELFFEHVDDRVTVPHWRPASWAAGGADRP
jgi:uncharacterized OB-fold protein